MYPVIRNRISPLLLHHLQHFLTRACFVSERYYFEVLEVPVIERVCRIELCFGKCVAEDHR